jgi:hypothetical protein
VRIFQSARFPRNPSSFAMALPSYRPGMGGSTPVELEKRMSIWLETVPLLLARLDIKRVALASHSAGTLYLLNTLYHYPHLMSTTKPYAALICPWVHPNHSHVTLMSAATMVPNGMISYFDQLTKAGLSFMTNTLGPALGVSSAALGASSGLLNSIPSLFAKNEATPLVEANDEEEKYLEMTGMTKEKATKFLEMVRMWIFTENTKGGNEEALLCLKKSKPGLWGICEDYEEYATSLRSKLGSDQPGSRLKLHAFFAEDDMMIGNGGKKYFDKCWTPQICGDVIGYESIQLEKTDHESIISPIHGVLSKIFEEARVSLS